MFLLYSLISPNLACDLCSWYNNNEEKKPKTNTETKKKKEKKRKKYYVHLPLIQSPKKKHKRDH